MTHTTSETPTSHKTILDNNGLDTFLFVVAGMLVMLVAGFLHGAQLGITEGRKDEYQDHRTCNVRGMFLSRAQKDLVVCTRPGRPRDFVVVLRGSARTRTN